MQQNRRVFDLSQDQYTKAGGVVTALACSTVSRDDQEGENFAGGWAETASTSGSAANQLLVGLGTGHVEEYRFDTKGQGSNLELFRTTKVSKKAIDQVCIVSSGTSKAVCALSGGSLWLLPSGGPPTPPAFPAGFSWDSLPDGGFVEAFAGYAPKLPIATKTKICRYPLTHLQHQ